MIEIKWLVRLTHEMFNRIQFIMCRLPILNDVNRIQDA